MRIATLHFAPTTTTLGREPLAKYWMLGNCELGVVLDRRSPDLVVHGHAHLGTLKGRTPGGVPVRNVALPIVGRVHLEVTGKDHQGTCPRPGTSAPRALAMSLRRATRHASDQQSDQFDSTIRLDLTHNPYGPCPAAFEAIEACLESPGESLAAAFRRGLGQTYRVPVMSIHLFESVDSAIRVLASRHPGPIIAFPPAATANLIAESCRRRDIVSIARGACGDAVVGPDFASDIPANGLAVIDSPSNPLGSIVSPADAVRLSRACTCVVIDERFAEYSEFSLATARTGARERHRDAVVCTVVRSAGDLLRLGSGSARIGRGIRPGIDRGATRGGRRGNGNTRESRFGRGNAEAGARGTLSALSLPTPAVVPATAPIVGAVHHRPGRDCVSPEPH